MGQGELSSLNAGGLATGDPNALRPLKINASAALKVEWTLRYGIAGYKPYLFHLWRTPASLNYVF